MALMMAAEATDSDGNAGRADRDEFTDQRVIAAYAGVRAKF